MRRYHPDKNPSVEAAARVRAITAAYAVLGVAEERAKYDEKHRSQRAVPRPPPAAERARLLRTASPALIVAGAAILALVANVVPAWVVPKKGVERSHGAGNTVTSASLSKRYAAATPKDAALCSSGVASQSIKRELFRRAARMHGSNPAALERIAGYSLVRFASPVVHYDAPEGAVIGCKARVVLHLPPGVTAPGGQQSLDGIVAYSLRGVGAGGAAGLSLTAEPAIVKALAFLAETSSEGARDLQ